jgi:hypothetical protein
MLASSDCPHAMDEASGRNRNGEAIARTFGNTVGNFPDLVRPTLLCACKQPALPFIGLHYEDWSPFVSRLTCRYRPISLNRTLGVSHFVFGSSKSRTQTGQPN